MIETILTALGGLIAGAGGVPAITYLLRTLHANRQERNAQAFSQSETVADRQERQIALLTKQMLQLQERADSASAHQRDCEVTLAEVYGYLVLQHSVNTRLAAAARCRGEDPGPVPSLPPRPKRDSEDEPSRRSTQQNSKLLESISGQMQGNPDDGGEK